MKVKKRFADEIARTADHARKSGWTVEITRMPSVSIDGPNGEGYFFQEIEASKLLDECPENVAKEDFLLWSAQGW